MTLAEISDLAQAVSAAAILVSLVFVGIPARQGNVQARQANLIARAEITSQLRARTGGMWTMLAADEVLGVAFSDAMFGSRPVDRNAGQRLLMWFGTYVGLARQAYLDHQRGLVDDFTLYDIEGNMLWMMSRPLFASEYERILRQREYADLQHDSADWFAHIERQRIRFSGNA